MKEKVEGNRDMVEGKEDKVSREEDKVEGKEDKVEAKVKHHEYKKEDTKEEAIAKLRVLISRYPDNSSSSYIFGRDARN